MASLAPHPTRRECAFLALATLALLVYATALTRHITNWPFTDDHTATLLFLIDWQAADSWRDRMALLLQPHNEHRLIFNHLVELIDVAVFGQIHFGHMAIVGNLCWAGALSVFLLAGRRAGLSWPELAPAVLLSATLSHHDLMIWAMGSLQQYGQIFFCLLAAWAASRQQFGWSLLAASAAAGSGGGGFAVFLALIVHWEAQRSRRRSLLTLLLASLWLILHIRNLPSASEGAHRLDHLLQHPVEAVGYTLCFLGSVGKSTQVSVVLGAIQVLCLAWLLRREGAMRRQPFFAMVALWLLVCAAMAALARLPLGLDQARSTRYTPHAIASVTAIGMLAVSLANTGSQRALRWRAWATLSLLLWATWLTHGWNQQAQQHKALIERRHISPPTQQEAQAILQTARERGVFNRAE